MSAARGVAAFVRAHRVEILLLVLAWVASFLLVADLGLYEDDYFFVGRAIGFKDGGWVRYLEHCFTRLPQGRPLGFLLPATATVLAYPVGGLPLVYLVGYLFVAGNAVLFYRLVRREYGEGIALVCALAFCLCPADTTRTLLTHNLGLQPALTCALVASHLFVRGRKAASYVAALGALLVYESAILPFLGIPLLRKRWDRTLARSLVKHVLVVLGLVAGVAVLRLATGEARVAGVGLDAVWKAIGATRIGPLASLSTFAVGPALALWAALRGDVVVLAATLAAAVLLVWVFLREAEKQAPDAGPPLVPASPRLRALVEGLTEMQLDGLRVVRAGAVILTVSYSLAFTHYPPRHIFGRGTSVHLAATVGAALVWGGLAYVAWCALARMGRRWLAALLLGGTLALLVGYGVVVQRDFARSWVYQKRFWTEVAGLCPDATNGTFILVVEKGLPETRFIRTQSWAVPIVLEQIFAFPAGWRRPPRVFPVRESWPGTVRSAGGVLRWTVPQATWPPYEAELEQGNVILLRVVDGKLQRLQGTVGVGTGSLRLKAVPPGTPPPRQPAHLHGLLLPDAG